MLIKFNPTQQSNFQFQATFDGSIYTCICTWNIFGQRYYINIYDQNRNRILILPLIASSDFYDINIIGGYFIESTMIFRGSSQTFEIN